ncbi:hypothetical protein ADL25_06980 [Streptomyces sp. NRRL F-5122]|nr:hypothetical protein ADL25_06980 [Streptomyces sp. NRRL F-5122]
MSLPAAPRSASAWCQAKLLRYGQALSVRTRSTRSMPQVWKKAAARRRNAAHVAAFSSGWISL